MSAELDSFDGRKDPERCAQLVNKLRSYQDKVLKIIGKKEDTRFLTFWIIDIYMLLFTQYFTPHDQRFYMVNEYMVKEFLFFLTP